MKVYIKSSNTRPLNKENSRNIKCEHCKYWQPGFPNRASSSYYSYDDAYGCTNPDSPKFDTVTNYWNRCKYFEWADKYMTEE